MILQKLTDYLSKTTNEGYDHRLEEPELTAKEYTDDKGNTQLHKEITRSDSKFLLKHEDVSKLKNKRGETPLHLAAWHHKEAISHPHASTVKDDDKVTPLHNAAEPFKEVLNHPDVSKVKDSDGVTPLHIAAIYHPDASKHPDYTKVKDNRGLTPKDFAEGKG